MRKKDMIIFTNNNFVQNVFKDNENYIFSLPVSKSLLWWGKLGQDGEARAAMP